VIDYCYWNEDTDSYLYGVMEYWSDWVIE